MSCFQCVQGGQVCDDHCGLCFTTEEEQNAIIANIQELTVKSKQPKSCHVPDSVPPPPC